MASQTLDEREIANKGPSVEYRAHLDGLRAVAVYFVVLFHAGVDRFVGGFIGVDVFFVLSGYLVTTLLLKDLDRLGHIRFSRFYSRRFRRLLPAAFAALVVAAAVFSAVATPSEVVDALGGFQAAFLYYANWFFLGQATDYWGPDVEASPVLHFWSLAVEEQFYLLWPVLLSAVFLITRSAGRLQPAFVRGIVAVGAALSLGAALRISDIDLNRAFYGSHTRAYQLLAGALLALTPGVFAFARRHIRPVRHLAVAALATLALLATPRIDLGPIQRGFAAVVTTSVLIVVLESAGGGVAQRFLALEPIAFLGKISYGTYLWHWPIVIVAARTFDLSPFGMAAITVLLATGVAALSYQMLERPIRESRFLDRHRGVTISAGLAISVCAGLVIVPALLDTEEGSGATIRSGTVSATGNAPVPDDLDWRGAKNDLPDLPDCLGEPAERCVIRRGVNQHVMLIGDSHARMLIPPLEEIAERNSLTLSVASAKGCPWQRDLTYLVFAENCAAHQADWYERVVPQLDPDIVVLAHRPLDDPANAADMLVRDSYIKFGTEQYEDSIGDLSAQTIHKLRSDDRDVLIIEPIPVASKDPTDCLSGATYLDECRYVAYQGMTPIERAYQTAAEADGVWSLDLDPVVCPYLPICDPVVDGIIVKRDADHMTGTFARRLADVIEAYMHENNVLQ